MLLSWMNSRGGTTKISVVMGVFKKADDTSQDVTLPVAKDAVLKKKM